MTGATPEDIENARALYETGMAPGGAYPAPDGGEFDHLLDLAGRVVWPEVWLDPGLDVRTRSLCTIAALTALGRPQIDDHIRRALAHGASRREIAEVITQMAIYAGWPAAMSAKRAAESVFIERDDDETKDC